MPPEAMRWHAQKSGNWTRPLLDLARYLLWMKTGSQKTSLDDLNDHDFQTGFENLWREMLAFRDNFFGFRVVPLVTWDAMVRYQLLPKPDKVIRLTISSYLAHQAKVYPHIFDLPIFDPPILELPEAPSPERNLQSVITSKLEGWLHRMFRPLIDSYAKKAYRASLGLDFVCGQGAHELDSDGRDAVMAGYNAAATKAFDEGWEQFRFYAKDAGIETNAGYQGFLELSENPSLRDRVAEHLSSIGDPVDPEDLVQVTFAHYISQHMRSWLIQQDPPATRRRNKFEQGIGAGPASLENRHDPSNVDLGPKGRDEDQGAPEGEPERQYLGLEPPYLILPDGAAYWTIEQAARLAGLSVDQLRRLDRMGRYTALRAVALVEDHFAEAPIPADYIGYKTNYRMYPSSSETIKQLRRLGDQLSTRQGGMLPDEMNRKTAAAAMGVPVSKLRSWEKSGKALPKHKNGSPIYTRDEVQRLRPLISLRIC